MSKGIIASVVGGIIGLVMVVSALSSFEVIDEGDRGVKLRYGQVVDVVEPGLNWKIPYTDTIKTIPVRTFKVSLDDYKTYSSDEQPATLSLSVTYKANEGKVKDLYSNYGTVAAMADRVVSPNLLTAIKNQFGKYSAANAIKNNDKLVNDITETLSRLVKNEPVDIVSVQVEKLYFSKAYEQNIEDERKAEVLVRTNTQNATAAVAKAEGEKQSAIKQAEGLAQSVILAGNAEAEAIRARAKALADNPKLVDLVVAEKWNGILPTTMVPGSSVPFVNVK